MRYLLILFFMVSGLLTSLASCDTDIPDTIPSPEQPVVPDDNDIPGNDDNNDNQNPSMSNHLKLTVGKTYFTITLEDNVTVKAFKTLLPMTVNMSEMNSNEKYYYLPEDLPTISSNPGIIQAGDLMLYGSSCMVLFYETFSTSYRYTRLGRIDNPTGLLAALGLESATVTLELQ